MIIDSNLVFSDGASLASGDSAAVGLTSFLIPGRMRPIPMCIRILAEDAAVTALEVQLKQADSKDGTYEDVPNACLAWEQDDLKTGKILSWRFLPSFATKSWLKLEYAVTGGDGSGKIFAALTREEDMPYVPGMYIDGGAVKG
ncbi:Bbp16 family capsid cement protein [Desulfovibrio sp. SGI.169]|uniref:Bbp16 family capsid cement protein n=1 Tax=Desulfovibrio sp. SGI.169 TaxID=3420561 RepID=UPI003D01F1DA